MAPALHPNESRRARQRLLCLFIAVVAAGLTWSATPTAEARVESTQLATLAGQTEPGQFTPLRGELPPAFDSFGSFHSHGTRVDPDTWNARGQWDPKRQRTFFYGDRRTSVFHSYDAQTNRWSHNALDERIPGIPHQYGVVGLDVEQGHFYRGAGGTTFRYVIDEDRWEVASESHGAGGTSPMEFHEGLGELLALGDQELRRFKDGQWHPYLNVSHNGSHANMLYNRARGEMIIVGGRHTGRRVSLLTDNGSLHEMGELPFDWSARHNSLSYDPVTGNFLVLHRKDYQLWEYDPSHDAWRLTQDWRASNQDDWEFGNFYGHVLIPIDELGVVLWMHRTGPMVYRHASAFADSSPSSAIARRPVGATDPTPRSLRAVPAPAPQDEPPATPREPAAAQPEIPSPPPALAGTELGRLAGALPPGSFQRLETPAPPAVERLRDFFRAETPQGRRVPIDGWTDSGHWDSERRRTFFLGLQGTSKFVSYDATENRWQELGWDGTPPPLHEPGGYTYGRTALDAEHGHYYRLADNALYRYQIDDGQWSRIDPAPIGGYTPIEWHKGLGMLINVRDHTVRGFDGERWHELGRAEASGEYSAARYNAQRDEVLVIGGKDTEQAVTLINREGQIREGAELPFEHQLSLDNLTYDPQSGRYLVLRWDERVLWEYDADADRWRRARDWSSNDWPFEQFGTVVPIPIDELGVIFWQYEHGPQIYRHQLAAETGVAQARERPSASPGRSTPAPSPSTGTSGPRPTIPAPQPGAHTEQPHERLAAIGASMTPGEWRYVETKNTPRFRVAFCPLDEEGSGSTHALGWTGSYEYDPGTQSFWAIGMRSRSEKRLFMLNKDLEWTEARIPLDECVRDRRPFNRLSLVDGYLYWASSGSIDGRRDSRGRLLRAPIKPYLEGDFDVPWEPYSEGLGISNMNAAGDFAVAWYPELRGWVFAGRRSGGPEPTPFSQEGHTAEGQQLGKHWYARVMFLRPPDPSWVQFDRVYSGQYRSQLVHNPVKRQMLLVPGGEFGSQPEGSEPSREWAIIHHDGGSRGLVRPSEDGPIPWVEKLDRPVGDGFELPGFSVRYGTVGYAPHTGDYIWWNRDYQVMWRSEDGKHWTVYEDFSNWDPTRFPDGVDSFDGSGGLFGVTGYVQMNAVPGTDLLVFFDPDKGVILHRMTTP